MATMQQCMAEARIKWGKSAHIEDRKRQTSPTTRAEAAQRREQLKQEIAGIYEVIKRLGNTTAALVKAGRFAVDVDGDEPSWSEFKHALERAEERARCDTRLAEATKEQREAASGIGAYRYAAGRVDHVGLSIFCIEVHADTLVELLNKIREWRPPTRRNRDGD